MEKYSYIFWNACHKAWEAYSERSYPADWWKAGNQSDYLKGRDNE